VVLFVVTGCAGSGELREESPEALSLDPEVATGTLDNGLTYFVRENQEPENRISLQLVVNAGSLQEEEDQQGLAHLLEHMAFNGTENFEKQELIDYLEMVGMDFGPEINAYTSFDETVYKLEIPGDDPEILDTALLILHDWARGITLDPEEVDKERKVVVEEWRLSRGAAGRIQDQQLPVLFSGARHAQRLPIGKMDVVEKAPVEELRDFYTTWYRPDLMAVIAVGDMDQELLVRKIQEQFSYPSQDGPSRGNYPVPDHEDTKVLVVTDPEAQYNQVELYFKKDPESFRTSEDFRKHIKESLYFQMFNRRIEEIVRGEDSPFLYAGGNSQRYVRTKEFGYLMGIPSSGRIEEGFRTLLEEAERVRRFGFTQGELSREKAKLMAAVENYYTERDNRDSSGLAEELKAHYLFEEPVPGVEVEYRLYKEFLPGITLEEMNLFGQTWLKEESRVILVSAPQGAEVPSESQLLKLVDRVSEAPLEPYQLEAQDRSLLDQIPQAGAILEEQNYPETGILRWTLSNGIEVLLKETDFRDNQVLFRAISPGGSSLVEDEEYISSQLAMSLAQESGMAGFTALELKDFLAGKSLSLSPWINDYYEGFSGQFAPEDGETFFQLLYLSFQDDQYTSEAYQSLMSRFSTYLENRQNSPQEIYQDRLQQLRSQNHFRRRPLDLEVLGEFDLDTAQQVGQERFANPADFTLFFVGNIDQPALREWLSLYVASLPASTARENFQDQGIRFPQGVIEETIKKGIEPQSRVHIAFGGEAQQRPWEPELFDSALRVLELRLHQRIREDMGGSYGVGVSGGISNVPRDSFAMNVEFGCQPGREEELSQAVLEEIRKLASGEVPEKDLIKVREGILRDLEEGLKQNGFWMGSMIELERQGKDLDSLYDTRDLVDLVDAESISRIFRTYIDEDRYIRLVLSPQE